MRSKVKIKDRSSEVEELLGTPPGWLSRCGSGMFLLIIVVALSLLSFIKYPQIIEGPVYIEIDNQDSIFTTIEIPINQSGYIKVGQMVQIQVDNFPNANFGFLEGRVDYISKKLTKSTNNTSEYYLIKIKMCNSLVTTMNKDISGYFSEMKGCGKITVREINFIDLIMAN